MVAVAVALTSMKGQATIQGVQRSAETTQATVIIRTAQCGVLGHGTAQCGVLRTRYLSGRVTHINRSKLMSRRLATDALLTV